MYRLGVLFILCLLGTLTLTGGSEFKLEELPKSTGYKAGDVQYDDGGMGPLFDFARSFINTALPDGFPEEFIKEMVDGGGSFDIVETAKKLLNMFKGYVAAIVVGLLFVVFVPLVGLCFCCCRMCGNCGGNNKQQVDDNIHCMRRILATVVFVLTVFTLVGTICTFVSNDRMSTSLDKVVDIVNNNLDDIDLFLDNIEAQVDVIGGTNLNRTQAAINDALDSTKLSDDISAFAVNDLTDGALDKLDQRIKSIMAAFDDVNKYISEVQKCSLPVCPTVPALNIDNSKLQALKTTDSPIYQVKAAIGSSFTVPDLSSYQSQAMKAFGDIHDQVDDIRQKIKDFRSDADSGINIQSYKDKVKSYKETASKYDKYRHTAGSALAGIITLIVTLQLMGLVFGSVGQGMRTDPEHRGCVSNTGGNMLMASVAFIFIFSWLLMLLTTLSFGVGAILERFICQPLSPPDFQLLKVVEDKFDVTDTLGAPIGSVLRDCQEGKAAFEAFHFDGRFFNFSDMEQQMDAQQTTIGDKMTEAMAKLSGNLAPGSALTDAEASLDQLSTMLNKINFNAFVLPGSTGIPNHDYQSMKNLKHSLDHLETFKSEVPKWKAEFTNSFSSVASSIGTKSTELVDKFQDRIISIGKTFLDTTKKQVRTEVGKCTPLWNLYNSIVVVSVCDYIVDAFNGFWFSIGWCLFFFVPSIIFSVKLSKHYRTMSGNKVEPSDDLQMSQY